VDLVLLALGLGALAAAVPKVRSRLADRRQRRQELVTVRRFAEEDAIQLGEELRRLDQTTAERELDDAGRRDYQTALDAYEAALRSVDTLETYDEISRVVDALSTGRFAVACVLARVDNRPLPTGRTPCFFNPQHGPATATVTWTRPGWGTRTVPACAQDAARTSAGNEPEVRYLRIDGRKVPYWEAGSVLEPYTRGYFPRVVDGRRDAVAAFNTLHHPVTGVDPDGPR
jgi:hypothetical protein